MAVFFNHSGRVQCETDSDEPAFERQRVTPYHYFKRAESLYFCEFPEEWYNADGNLGIERAPPRTISFPRMALTAAAAVYGSDLPANFSWSAPCKPAASIEQCIIQAISTYPWYTGLTSKD